MTSPNFGPKAMPEPVSNADQQAVANERMARLAAIGNEAPPQPAPPPPQPRRPTPPSQGQPGMQALGMIAVTYFENGEPDVWLRGCEFRNRYIVVAQDSKGGLAVTSIEKPASD